MTTDERNIEVTYEKMSLRKRIILVKKCIKEIMNTREVMKICDITIITGLVEETYNRRKAAHDMLYKAYINIPEGQKRVIIEVLEPNEKQCLWLQLPRQTVIQVKPRDTIKAKLIMLWMKMLDVLNRVAVELSFKPEVES